MAYKTAEGGAASQKLMQTINYNGDALPKVNQHSVDQKDNQQWSWIFNGYFILKAAEHTGRASYAS